MNGSRLTERVLCSLMHAASRHGRIYRQRYRFDHISLRKINRVTFTTYQQLMKQNDDTQSGSSSSESDSSDSDSDSDNEALKHRPQLDANISNTDSILAILTKGNKKPLNTTSSPKKITENRDSESANLLNLLKKNDEKPKLADKGQSSDFESLKNILKESINTELVSEAQKLSRILPGDEQETESKLLGQLLNQFETTARQKKEDPKHVSEKVSQSLSEVLEGLTVRKVPDKAQTGKNFDIDHEEVEKPSFLFRKPGIGLFTGKPLQIFTKDYMKTAKTDKKTLYEVVAEEEQSLSQFYPAENAFDEHIQWTREGKLWTFPLDNEAGWEEEKNTGFQQHVFLENELVGFPKKGPIRHFMELVTVALSKNPYLTYTQKCENIDWYRSYFFEKQEMLEERLGVDGIVASKQS